MGSGCTKCWHQHTSCVEHGLEKLFGKWGFFVANHPLITLIFSIILAGVLSIFIINIESETLIQNLYAPKGTTSYDNYLKYQDTWAIYEDDVGFNAIIAFDKLDPNKNIFTNQYLTLWLELYSAINEMEITYNNSKYTFQDICVRYENGNCNVQSVLELYDFNQTIIDTQFDTINIGYPAPFSSYSGQNLFIPLYLGRNLTLEPRAVTNDNTPSPTSPATSGNGLQTTEFFSTSMTNTAIIDSNVEYEIVITESPAFRMQFQIDLEYWPSDLCYAWYEAFLELMQDWADDDEKNPLFTLTWEGYNSFDDELTKAVASDITSFIISFVLLSVFSTVMVLRFKKRSGNKDENDGKCNFCSCLDPTRNRSRIGWLGIVSSVMAVGASFGLVGGLFGVKFNSVVSISPFLLVGLGCMFKTDIYNFLCGVFVDIFQHIWFGLDLVHKVMNQNNNNFSIEK